MDALVLLMFVLPIMLLLCFAVTAISATIFFIIRDEINKRRNRR
jgi:ABC-type polysaccharide/polyol phosphate export permease